MYSWPRLVWPNTEELFSRPFVGENGFRLVLQHRVSAENAIGCLFFRSHLLFFRLPQSPTVSTAQWVISNGFVPKSPNRICHQCNFVFLLHFMSQVWMDCTILWFSPFFWMTYFNVYFVSIHIGEHRRNWMNIMTRSGKQWLHIRVDHTWRISINSSSNLETTML